MKYNLILSLLCGVLATSCLDLSDVKDNIEDQLGDGFAQFEIEGTWELNYQDLPSVHEWMTFEASLNGIELVDYRAGNDFASAVNLTHTITSTEFFFSEAGHLEGYFERAWFSEGHLYEQEAIVDVTMELDRMRLVGFVSWENTLDGAAAGYGQEAVTFELEGF